jgi:hypothetical protein
VETRTVDVAPSGQLIGLFCSDKCWWIFGVIFGASIIPTDPIVGSVVILVSVLAAFAGLWPIRLTGSGDEAAIEVLRVLQWERWSRDQIVRVQYSHWPWMLRGRARLRITTTDGSRIKLPGTNGAMFWRHPDLSLQPRSSSKRLRIVRTVEFLRLVHHHLGHDIETGGAELMSPERPE